MNRIYLCSLALALALPLSAFAQSNRADDDIYYTPADAAQTVDDPAPQAAPTDSRHSSNGTSYSDGYYDDGANAYEDDYSDYEDSYTYSSRINRFYRPMTRVGYWSMFYNPYWYDPFWYDPYWGYNPWYQPTVSISFGYGPYWSSYWGWNTWCGYPGFYSYWNYPYYGGWGYSGWGYNAGYYNGYWNGYYAGLYNGSYGNGYGWRNVSYGPRYGMNTNFNQVNNGGTRGYQSNSPRNSERSGVRPATQQGAVRGDGIRGLDNNPRDARQAPVPGNDAIRNDNVRNIPGDNAQNGRQPGGRFEPVNPDRNGAVRQPDRYEQGTPRNTPQPNMPRRTFDNPRQSAPVYQQPAPRTVPQPAPAPRAMPQPAPTRPMAQPAPRPAPAPRMDAPRGGGFGGGNGGGRTSSPAPSRGGGGFGGRR